MHYAALRLIHIYTAFRKILKQKHKQHRMGVCKKPVLPVSQAQAQRCPLSTRQVPVNPPNSPSCLARCPFTDSFRITCCPFRS